MPEQDSTASPDHYLVSASGRLGKPPRSEVTEVDRILDLAMSQKPEKGLVLHFHGGLVKRTTALSSIVPALTERYKQAKSYPLFFVWESGFVETLLNNSTQLLGDPAFRELVKKVSEWVLKKVSPTGEVTFRGAAGEPIEDVDRFREEYEQWFDDARDAPPVEDSDIAGDGGATTRASTGVPDVDELADAIRKRLDDDPKFKKVMRETFNAANPPDVDVTTKGEGTTKRADVLLLSSAALDEMFEPRAASSSDDQVKERDVFTLAKVALYVAKLVIAVVKRFRNKSDHGVYCTVVEEVLRSAYGDLIGATIWSAMKQDTLDSFADGVDTCGRLVVGKLKALQEAGQQFKKLTLVGHSTGAIYICNFLDAAKAAGLKTPVQVVFLAPAITCARFAQALGEHEDNALHHFRMFAMRDARESADQMLKPLYTRSLLYFVSGLLEGTASAGKWSATIDMPLVGMERYFLDGPFGTDASVAKVSKFLNAAPNRMVWSHAQSSLPGLSSDAGRHGDFDNDEATLKSLQEIIGA